MQTYPFGGGHWTCPMLMETNSFGKEYTTTHIHEDETVLQYKKLIHRWFNLCMNWQWCHTSQPRAISQYLYVLLDLLAIALKPLTRHWSHNLHSKTYIYTYIYICNTYICLGGSVDLVSLGLTLLHNWFQHDATEAGLWRLCRNAAHMAVGVPSERLMCQHWSPGPKKCGKTKKPDHVVC